MGQVPIRYAIIGDGRLATHLAHYFALCGIPHRQWSRRTRSPAREPVAQVAGECPVWLVLISDSAIEGFIEATLRESPGLRGRVTFVHASGSLVTPLATGMHPLSSFSHGELWSREAYESIPWVVEQGGPSFRELFPALRNPSFPIRREDKGLYHALCVMAGNYTALLWQKLFQEFESRLGLPRQAGEPYLRQVFANLARDPGAALTGPLARGDEATVIRNIASLEGDPFQQVYSAFVHAFAAQAARKGPTHEQRRN